MWGVAFTACVVFSFSCLCTLLAWWKWCCFVFCTPQWIMQRHTTFRLENKDKRSRLINGDQVVGRQKPAHHQPVTPTAWGVLLRYFWGCVQCLVSSVWFRRSVLDCLPGLVALLVAGGCAIGVAPIFLIDCCCLYCSAYLVFMSADACLMEFSFSLCVNFLIL